MLLYVVILHGLSHAVLPLSCYLTPVTVPCLCIVSYATALWLLESGTCTLCHSHILLSVFAFLTIVLLLHHTFSVVHCLITCCSFVFLGVYLTSTSLPVQGREGGAWVYLPDYSSAIIYSGK